MVEPNLIVNKRGQRQCGTCKRERNAKQQREYRKRLKEAGLKSVTGAGPCHQRLAHHVCIQDAGHNKADHRCPCGETWALSVAAPSG
jgi:hypothetical protein